MHADLHICCSHMAKTGFLMAWLNSKDISLAMSEFFNLNMFILLQSLRELNENINVHWKYLMYKYMAVDFKIITWTANLVLIAYASSEGSGEPAHLRSLARTFAAR